MNISSLIDQLTEIKESDGNLEVTILDGFNGGGNPRTINLEPSTYHSTYGSCAVDKSDIKTKHGKFVCMGFGRY